MPSWEEIAADAANWRGEIPPLDLGDESSTNGHGHYEPDNVAQIHPAKSKVIKPSLDDILAAEQTRKDFKRQTFKQIMAYQAPAPAPIIGNLIQRGQRSVIYGGPGHGKSTLVNQMRKTAWYGGDFLGFKSAGEHRSLLIQADQEIGSEQFDIREMNMMQDENLETIIMENGFNIEDPDDWRNLTDEIGASITEYGDLSWVIFDSLHAINEKDESSNLDMKPIMARLDAIKRKFFVHVMLIHHTKKDETTYIYSGATTIIRKAEVVLGIRRKATEQTLYFEKLRESVPEANQTDLWKIEFDVDKHTFSYPEAKPDLKRLVWQYLDTYGTDFTQSQIVAGVKEQYNTDVSIETAKVGKRQYLKLHGISS